LKVHFGEVFGLEMKAVTRDDLLDRLRKAESTNLTTSVAQPVLTTQEQI
jgi:hypothetical protein